MHLAARHGHTDVAEGAPTEVMDKDGNTPLHLAALGGHSSIVKLLLGNGALIEARNKDSNTAQQLAAQNGIVDLLRN